MALRPVYRSDESENRPLEGEVLDRTSQRSLAIQHALQTRKPAPPPTPVERAFGIIPDATDSKHRNKVKRIGQLTDRFNYGRRAYLYLELGAVKETRDGASVMQSLIWETQPGELPDLAARGQTQDALERIPGMLDRMMGQFEAEMSELISDR
jgi:hypothetical protein